MLNRRTLKSLSKGLHFTGNERLEAARVEAEGAEYVREGAENLAGGGTSLTSSAVHEEPRRSVLCPGNSRIVRRVYFARKYA